MIALHCLKPNHSPRCVVVRQVEKRTPPHIGLVCLDVDAPIFTSSSSSAASAVTRDHMGRCLVGCHQSLHVSPTPEFTEALALHCVVLLVLDESFHNLFLHSDCLPLIKKVNAPDRDRSFTSLVVADIKSLASNFASFFIYSCKPLR